MRDGLAALLQQAQQQQQQVCGVAEQQQQQQGQLLAQQQQMVVVDACCDGSSDDCSSAMEVDGAAAPTAAAAAAFKPHQQQQQDWDVSGACSSAASDVFIPEDSETLASSTLSLLPHGQQQRLRRIPRSSSASTLSSVQDTGLGFSAAGDNSSSHSSKPLSTEAANAAAAAAAAAAVPASASLQGVLSLTAAAAAAAGSAAAAAAAVESGAFGALGPRESMEDRHVVVQGLGGDARVTLAAVFDGHRGHEAAAYAAAQLPRNLLLASVLEGSSSSPAVQVASSEQPAADDSTGAALALKRSFLATDAVFWQEWQAEMHAHATAGQYTERYPGCTALAAVLAGSQLFVANAGDGRAVLSRGGTAVPLSRQHTADLQDERERVLAAGGTVAFRGGSWRVGTAALQVTRALGDFDLKVPAQQPSQQQQRYSPYSCNPLSSASSSSSMPVTAEPEVVSLQLSGVDQFLILGTDGLWDVIGDQEAVGLVHDTVKDPFLCAKRLVMEALSRGSSDNVSAVVLFLQPKHTLERVWVRGGGAAVPAATPTFYGSRRLTTQQAAEQAGDGAAAAAAGPAGAADEMMDTY
jgi:serine/threonine protein phosphatase PrpC